MNPVIAMAALLGFMLAVLALRVVVEDHGADVARFGRRVVRALKIVARDKRIPRPVRALALVGVLPIPGPVDELVLLAVAPVLIVAYRQPLREAWATASERT